MGGGPGLGIQYFKPDFELFTIPNAEHAVLGGRLFVGYQFNTHWGVEFGYTNIGSYYNNGSDNNFVCTSENLEDCLKNFYPLEEVFNENLSVKNSINASAIDLTVLYHFPITTHLNVFAKAGAAYMDVTTQSNVNISLNFFPNTPEHFSIPFSAQTNSSNHGSFWQQINPVLGIGDEYAFGKHFSVRFEYDYYFPVKLHGDNIANSGTLIPSILLGELVYSF
jgi:opacity protein-like surface antigen